MQKIIKTIRNIILSFFIEPARTPLVTFSFSKLKKEVHEYSNYEFIEPSLSKIFLPNEARRMQYLLEPLVIPRPYYFFERNAKLFGSIPLVLDNNYYLVLEALPQNPIVPSEFYKQVNSSLFFRIFFNKKVFNHRYNPKRNIDYAVVLTNSYTHNYYHFIVDSLLKVNTIHQAIKNNGISGQLKFVVSHKQPKWLRKYLHLLNIDENSLISIQEGECIEIENLLVPSPRRFNHFLSKESVNYLKKIIFTNLDFQVKQISPSRLIYISRNKAQRRKLLNENELVSALEKKGFELINLEDLSVAEQIQLMSETQLVCAPHGAGLANLIFCDIPRLIELLPHDHYGFSHYVGLCISLDGEYRCVIGDYQDNKDNFIVNISEVLSIVENLIMSSEF